MTSLNLELVFVFFIYGLAFFAMGIALSLETLRSSRLAERRLLLLLSLFGILHGIHEWMEVVILQGVWTGSPFPAQLSWFRVVWLTLSFIPLVAFGVSTLQLSARHPILQFIVPAALVLLDALALFVFSRSIQVDRVRLADVLARYLFAVPGGILAGIGLLSRARQTMTEGQPSFARYFRWSASGFIIYGLTQIFVSRLDIIPAKFINAELFLSLTGLPIQVVRAAMAVLITVAFIQVIQHIERGREQQLLAAQKARVEALEQVQRELVEREVLRRQLLRHTVIAQEDERSRIARELHDETSQILTAFSLNLAALRSSLAKRRDATRLIAELQNLSQRVSASLYRIVHDLRPAQLDDLGLVPALHYLTDEARERLGLDVRLVISGPRQRLDPLIETVVFRIAQEALTNVGRHAKTNQAQIELCFDPSTVTLRVSDQGIGFDVRQIFSPPRGWGLAGMRERAESLDGQFQVQSKISSGTLIDVVIPLGAGSPAESPAGELAK